MPGLHTLIADEPIHSPADRRIWVRYGGDLNATCHETGPMKQSGWSARVHDISAGGVGLVLRHRFRPGTPLLLELHGSKGSISRIVPARVVHTQVVRGEIEPHWHVGCAFIRPFSESELKELL